MVAFVYQGDKGCSRVPVVELKPLIFMVLQCWAHATGILFSMIYNFSRGT